MRRDKTVAYLISEAATESKPEILKPVNSLVDSVRINAILQDLDVWNRNQRNYPKKVMEPGLNDPRIVELVKNKSWVGEAGHPINPTPVRQMSIDNTNISHRVNNWCFDRNIVKGEVETLMTPQGISMRDLIRQELNVAFSLRAMGKVQQTSRGALVVGPVRVLCYDWVFIPSHKDAYQQSIISESVQPNMLTEGYCIPLMESAALDYIQSESENFRIMSEFFEFAPDGIQLLEGNRSIMVEDKSKNGDKLIIGVEDYISQEINGFFRSFKN